MDDQSKFNYIENLYRAQFLQLQKDLEKDYDVLLRQFKLRIQQIVDKYAVNGIINKKDLAAIKEELTLETNNYSNSTATWIDTYLAASIRLSLDGHDMASLSLIRDLVQRQEVAASLLKDTLSGKLPVLIRVQYGTGLDNYVRNQVWQYRWTDGFNLSDRVWKQGATIRQNLDSMIEQCVNSGVSAVEFSRAVELYLESSGPAWTTQIKPSITGNGSVKYNALRLARTETNQGYHKGQNIAAEQSVIVKGIQWNLSKSHPKKDICDIYATQDLYGLGPGIYLPSKTPKDHPNGLCYLFNVLYEGKDLIDRIRAKYKIAA